MPLRSQRWGLFSCTPGERVTTCSCISVGPSSVVATGPRAVSTVAIRTSVGVRASPRADLEHRVVPAHGGQDDRLDRRLAQEALGRLASRLLVRETLHLVDHDDHASVARYAFASALGMGQDAR